MQAVARYAPHAVFAPPGTGAQEAPRVFLSPQRYIQGEGVIDHVGRYLSLLAPKRAAVLISARGHNGDGQRILTSMAAVGIEALVRIFRGECSLEEIDHHVTALQATDRPAVGVDCLLAVGGGKCVDAGKAIAHRLQLPVVVIPTLASNDAPTSALSVIYTPQGVATGGEFYPQNPALVIVDTGIVAKAPARYLVAGIGDAMATWYEARACLRNARGRNVVGARPTLAAGAIGEVCAQTLFAKGEAAVAAVEAGRVDAALEDIVEANTLLSGIGFESGGLAGAHGIAQSFTEIPHVHANFLHGEMVAMGTLAQLQLEGATEDAQRMTEFFCRVGLPVHLGQIGVSANDDAVIDVLVNGLLKFPFIRNLQVKVTAESARSAILGAHALGTTVAARVGDAAYRRLHA